jgi:IclR family acetate operon transcriptional repressor
MLPIQELESQATESYPGTQAVARAIGLLKVFSDAQPEWNLSELAQVTRLNKTTAFRLLAALEAEGLVMRNPLSGGYRLGVELVALGGCAMRSNPLRAMSRPVLESLAQECDEAATLEVLAGSHLLGNTHVLIVDEVSSRHPMGMSQDVGSRLPAHATATGKVLLAHMAADALPALLRPPLAQLTEATVTDPARLHTQLEQIRRQGYAITRDELEPGFVAIAAPVYDRDRQAAAAISIGGASLRLPAARVVEVAALVQMAARQISRQLGYWPG